MSDKKQPKYTSLNVSMPQPMADRVQRVADQHDRPVSAVTRYALTLYFAYLDQNPDARVHIHERVKVSNVHVELV